MAWFHLMRKDDLYVMSKWFHTDFLERAGFETMMKMEVRGKWRTVTDDAGVETKRIVYLFEAASADVHISDSLLSGETFSHMGRFVNYPELEKEWSSWKDSKRDERLERARARAKARRIRNGMAVTETPPPCDNP